MIHDLRPISLLAACALLVACGDPFQPVLSPIPDPQEAILVDFAGGDLVDPAAYDMFTSGPVRTDQTGSWDFVFVVDDDMGPVLLPRQDVLEEESSAGLQASTQSFDQLEKAPEDGYTTDAPVRIAAGDVFLMISRKSTATTVRCRLFGKMEVESIDGDPVQLTLRAVVNPNCEQRDLIEDTSN